MASLCIIDTRGKTVEEVAAELRDNGFGGHCHDFNYPQPGKILMLEGSTRSLRVIDECGSRLTLSPGQDLVYMGAQWLRTEWQGNKLC